ncbi:hypothetical protein [Pseudophaeobacter sp.]|uniref:hypothetical protein n=1 Tax=Pseudophaeobacter sp. TaxID=1971739 RepID=UPI003A984AB8
MKFRAVVLAAGIMLATLSPAYAFVAIGSAVISAFLAVGAGALLPTVGAAAIGLATVGIAVTAAQVALQAALFGRQPSVDPNEIKNTTQGKEGPGRYAFGRVRLAGTVAFGNTAGYDIYRLLLHCFGPLSAIEEYFYDKLSVTVDPDGAVTSPPWARSGGSNLYLKTKVGNGSETAWPELVGDFPSLWTADHRVRGIAQTLIEAINPGTGSDRFLRLFQGGIKSVEITARVGEFYDPRDNSTEWSINGVLHVLHWWRRLPGMRDTHIDFDAIEPVVTQGEALVPTLMGTAPRCQLSGGWEGPLTYDIVEDMLESAGLEVQETGDGKEALAFIEDWPEPEITFLNRHIIDRFPQAGPEGAKRPNVCKLRYFSPERGFEMAEIDLTGAPWARVQHEIDVYGEQEFPVDLIFCCDASQAQRIARRLFLMARTDFGVIKTTMAGVAAWGKRTALIEIPDVGEDGASIMVRARTQPVRVDDSAGECEIAFHIIPDALSIPWDPETMEVPAPPVLPEFQIESDLDKPSVASTAVVQYPGGAYETRMRFSSVAGGSTAEANYRTYTGGLPDTWQGMTEYSANGQFAYAAVNTIGKEAEFRVRWFNGDGEASYFSDVVNVPDMQIDNSVPTEPYLDVQVTNNGVGDYTFEVVAYSTAMNAVRFVLSSNQPEITPGYDGDTRPGLGYTADGTISNGPAAINVTITATVYTSNGTPSPTATFTYVIPQDPNTNP